MKEKTTRTYFIGIHLFNYETKEGIQLITRLQFAPLEKELYKSKSKFILNTNASL